MIRPSAVLLKEHPQDFKRFQTALSHYPKNSLSESENSQPLLLFARPTSGKQGNATDGPGRQVVNEFPDATASWCKHATYLWKYQALKVIFNSKLILLYENLLECCNISTCIVIVTLFYRDKNNTIFQIYGTNKALYDPIGCPFCPE